MLVIYVLSLKFTMVITNIYILRYFNKHEQVYYYDIIACTFRLY